MKKKVYLVPHTHWDREWYFTKDTGDVLLNHMVNDIVNHKGESPMMLDGQFSLLDDYLKWNPEDKEKIKIKLKKSVISSGPFYTQPDVFNSSGETTIRNIEMGIKVGKELGQNPLSTAYLPDTFGFNQNLPQIFNLKGLKNFIFWRGISSDQSKKSFYFNWEGIDGSKVKSYNFQKGYFSIGPWYPYNGVKSGVKNDMKRLNSRIEELVDGINMKKPPFILPLGGDQAPYLHEAKKIVDKLNKISEKYSYEVISNYDKFFQEQKNPDETNFGDLKTPFTGKIHRTISSSRYDIKKEFRNAEDNIYYLLEPLELYYSSIDKDYNFNNFKEENIIKPLLIAQAHDSLGGCNTDETNEGAINRIKRILDFSNSQIDLLIKKIIMEKNIENESFVFFNPAPFENKFFERKTIYSDEHQDFFIKDKNYSIYTISSKNISLNPKKNIYEIDALIYKNNMKSFGIDNLGHISNSDKMNFNSNKIKDTAIIAKSNINIILNNKKISLAFSAKQDLGDGYDFSPGEKLSLIQKHKVLKNIEISQGIEFVEMRSSLKIGKEVSYINWNIFIDKKKEDIKTNFEIINNFVNVRISLDFEKTKEQHVYKSQHLAISKFIDNDYEYNWQENFKEYPAHVDQNDGLVNFGDWNIMTQGTNEIFEEDNKLRLVLYRTNDLVTKGNMKWRPSTSGLSFEWAAESSKMLKTLKFDLGFNTLKNKAQAMNEWKYKPYLYKEQKRNFIANKMTKFVVNDILNKSSKETTIDSNKDVFISSMKLEGKDIKLRVANLVGENNKFKIKINNKKIEKTIKPYKIEEIMVEG